ncbi:MAG TPA: hypothetical protein VNO30_41290 [Kofleriaceae bacterium]|nr:hypothetical protein [Kofleriaceae bacterium]
MPLPAHFIESLACPRCKQPILYFPRGEADEGEGEGEGEGEADAFLLCPACRLRFGITDGIANLIADEATALPPPAVERLVTRAREIQAKSKR